MELKNKNKLKKFLNKKNETTNEAVKDELVVEVNKTIIVENNRILLQE